MKLFCLGVPEHMAARVNRALEAEGLRVSDRPVTESPLLGAHVTEWLEVVNGPAPAGVPVLLEYRDEPRPCKQAGLRCDAPRCGCYR